MLKKKHFTDGNRSIIILLFIILLYFLIKVLSNKTLSLREPFDWYEILFRRQVDQYIGKTSLTVQVSYKYRIVSGIYQYYRVYV